MAACVNSCGDKLVSGLLDVYECFYKEKVGNKKEYSKLKVRQQHE